MPWNTPAGQAIVAQRHRRSWWLDNVLVLALAVLILVAALCGLVSALKSPGSAFCPSPRSNRPTRALLKEIETLGAQLQEPELAAEQREAARTRLSGLLSHGDRIIRRTAAWALADGDIGALEAQIKQPELSAEQREIARSRLEAFLQQDDKIIRWKAGSVLADVGDPRGIQWLIDQLDQGDKTMQLLAKSQLARVTGQGGDWDRAAWKRWWKAHKDDPLLVSSGRVDIRSEVDTRRESR